MRYPVLLAAAAAAALTACTAHVARPRPQASQAAGQGEGQASVWVCHGRRHPRWQRVAAPAADAHRRHGDRVSTTPRAEGASCAEAAPRH